LLSQSSGLDIKNVGPPKSFDFHPSKLAPARREIRKDSAAHVSLSSDPQFQTASASVSPLTQPPGMPEGFDEIQFRPRPEKIPQYE
jgi:hypothetical protein